MGAYPQKTITVLIAVAYNMGHSRIILIFFDAILLGKGFETKK